MTFALVGPSYFNRFFDRPSAELERRGHRLMRFESRETLLADVHHLPAIEVLAASSNFVANGELFDLMPRLHTLVSPFTGVEGFDLEAATARGILVSNGQIEENSVSMAEAGVLLILASLYDLHETERHLRENLPRPARMRARMLMGKTVGLIGFGKIGQAIAERLSVWGVRVIASLRTPRPLPNYVAAASLDTLLGTSDVVVVTAALNAQTRAMLGPDQLRKMKQDVVFVNITRGGIVADDEIAALAIQRPSMRVALDVFEPEPLRSDSPLRYLPNAILTPHMIGHTMESQSRLPVAFYETLVSVSEGRVPERVVNPSTIESWVARTA